MKEEKAIKHLLERIAACERELLIVELEYQDAVERWRSWRKRALTAEAALDASK